MDRIIQRALRPIRQRMQKMAYRAVVRLAQEGKMQTLQIEGMDGETLDGVEHFQSYGFTYVPLDGSEAIAVSVGGNRSHPIVIAATDRRYRPGDLAPGEACIYTHEDGGGQCRIHLKNGKEVHFCAGENSIVMTPNGITMTTNAFDIMKR